jgi:hypothetical protein
MFFEILVILVGVSLLILAWNSLTIRGELGSVKDPVASRCAPNY